MFSRFALSLGLLACACAAPDASDAATCHHEVMGEPTNLTVFVSLDELCAEVHCPANLDAAIAGVEHNAGPGRCVGTLSSNCGLDTVSVNWGTRSETWDFGTYQGSGNLVAAVYSSDDAFTVAGCTANHFLANHSSGDCFSSKTQRSLCGQ